jgi:hypothetical protein
MARTNGGVFVLLNAFRTLVLLAAAAAPVAAAASDPKPEPRDQREAQPRRAAPPELICRAVAIAETREMPMVCMSAAEWRRAADQ